MLLSSIRQSSGDNEEEEEDDEVQPERALRNVILVDVDAVVIAKPVATILTSLVKTSTRRRELLLETLFTILDVPDHEKSVLSLMEASGGIRTLALTLPLIERKDENKLRLVELVRKMLLNSKSEHDDATREALTNALSDMLSATCTDERLKDEATLVATSLLSRGTLYHKLLAPVVCILLVLERLSLFFSFSLSLSLHSHIHTRNTNPYK